MRKLWLMSCRIALTSLHFVTVSPSCAVFHCILLYTWISSSLNTIQYMLRYKLEEIQHQTDLSKLNVSPNLVFCTFYNKFRVLFQIRTIIFAMLWTWSIPELCIMYVVMELRKRRKMENWRIYGERRITEGTQRWWPAGRSLSFTFYLLSCGCYGAVDDETLPLLLFNDNWLKGWIALFWVLDVFSILFKLPWFVWLAFVHFEWINYFVFCKYFRCHGLAC